MLNLASMAMFCPILNITVPCEKTGDIPGHLAVVPSPGSSLWDLAHFVISVTISTPLGRVLKRHQATGSQANRSSALTLSSYSLVQTERS